MARTYVEGLSDRLAAGADDDLWFDAAGQGDVFAANRIDETRAAVSETARLLPELAGLLRALRDVVPDGSVDQDLLDRVDAVLEPLDAPLLHVRIDYHPDHSGGLSGGFDGLTHHVLVPEHEIDLEDRTGVERVFEDITGLHRSAMISIDEDALWTSDDRRVPVPGQDVAFPGGPL